MEETKLDYIEADPTADIYKSSRVMYIIEAALEYFISLLVSGVYLARLTSSIGIPDHVTGILSSLTTLGCSVQLFAILWAGKKRVKRTVIFMHTSNQLLFTLIYVVPFLDLTTAEKTAVFLVLKLGGALIHNIVQPLKINWFMSMVDDKKRGKFTANKEIISLVGGIVFTFTMGNISDRLEEAGRIKDSFIVCGVTLLVLTIFHTYTMIASKEKPVKDKDRLPLKKMLKTLATDMSFMKIVLVSVLWSVVTHCYTPFNGTYAIKELGLTLTMTSIVTAIQSTSRALCSRPLGKYADKNSFAKMLNICFAVELVAFTLNIFTVPANGMIFYTAYHVLYSIGLAGINSGGINLIYERVPREMRVCALAFKNTLAGLVGFCTTLLASILFKRIQDNGNTFLGMDVYGQQVMSALSAIGVVVLLVYHNTVVRRMTKKTSE